MSEKKLDKCNRWRNKVVAFRMSPEEDAQLETAVKLSGLTKQEYIIRRLLDRDVVVQRMDAGTAVDGELMETIQLIANILDGMKEENAYDA